MTSSKYKYVVKPFHQGSVIFREGQPGKAAYLIKTGKVVIYRTLDNQDVVLETLGQGAVFGEIAVITGEPRAASAKAAEYCELVVIDNEYLSQALKECPPIIQNMTTLLFDRLRATTAKLTTAPTSNTFMTVCYMLELLGRANRRPPQVGKDGKPLPPSRSVALSYAETCKYIKKIVPISQMEIDQEIKKLESINALESSTHKINGSLYNRTITIRDLDQLLPSAEKFMQTWQGSLPFEAQDRNFLDIMDFAERVGSTLEMIYQKVGNAEIPENLLFVPRQEAMAWVGEVGKDFLKTTKKKKHRLENISTVDDVLLVDDATLQEVFDKLGHYKLAILLTMASGQGKQKILGNMSRNIAQVVLSEAKLHVNADPLESQDIEAELIRLIKEQKGLTT